MSVLCFGEFAKIIKKATTESDENVVALLLGAIVEPVSLLNKNGDAYYFEKKEVSELMNSKMNFPIEIVRAANSEPVLRSISKYFNGRVFPNIVVKTPVTWLAHVRSLVVNDVTIIPTERNDLLSKANEATIAEFFGSVLIWCVQSANDHKQKPEKKAKLFDAPTAPAAGTTETYLLAEVGMRCPFCGGTFMKTKGGVAIPEYSITEIYPVGATVAQTAVLSTLPLPDYSLDDIQNKIAMCVSCKNDYLSMFSAGEYNRLLSLKTDAAKLYQAQTQIEKIDLENALTEIVARLASCSQEDLKVSLANEALKVDRKIPMTETNLNRKVTFYISAYYPFVNDLFVQSSAGDFDFDLLCQEVKFCCEKLLKRDLSQPEVFATMTKWIKGKTKTKDDLAAEVVVSFFVQNCEVFHEIP